MEKIPFIQKDEVEGEAAEAWKALPFDLALFHICAHAQNVFKPWLEFNGTCWQRDPEGMAPLLKEMAVVHASVLSNSPYEWANHAVGILREGGTQDQVDAIIEARDPKADGFDATQKLVLQFTTEVVNDGRPAEGTLTSMSEKFTSMQLVQLVYAICTYMMNSRLANLGGLQQGDDEDFGTSFTGRKK